jgi:DME family drug/metabolite transporter
MIGELAALGAALTWTASAVLYKEALSKARPVPVNVVRLLCTSMILLVCLVVVGRFWALANLSSYAMWLAGISGIVGLGFGDTLYMVSLKHIGVARAVPITCTYPLFGLLWAILLRGENVTIQLTIGTVAIAMGIWLLSREERTNLTDERKIMIIGVVAALAAALLWSISITMVDVAVTLPETGSLDYALAINTLRTAAGAVALVIFAPVIDRKPVFLKFERRTLLALIAGGIVALGLGWFLLAYSFLYIPGSQAVPISSTTPLFSTLVGITLLHERITARNVAGSVIIVLAIFVIFII